MPVPSDKGDSSYLIQTKLYQPQANPAFVDRPHLLARLDAGLSHKLILVSAPPGFGKSTLVAQWLARRGQPAAWISLDEGDNALPQFLAYLCAAVRRLAPDACATMQGLLAVATLPEVDYLADLLVDELTALPVDLILVLDDYNRIRSSEVHQVVRRLLRYPPPRLHLMILTRSDPPLHLGRLRLEQQITEVRVANLRFTLDETRLFLQNLAGQPPDLGTVQSIQTRTEGWIIGLQLAGISMQSQSAAQFLQTFGGDHRMLVGYLIEEVMTGLPEAVREFMIRTALVNRFCASLGDALLASTPWEGTAQATIAWLEAENMFVVPLDDTGNWYRYHDLFRDFLQHQIKKDQGANGLAVLHRRAAAWLAEAGQIGDALRHALAAGDALAAAGILETNLHPLLNHRAPAPVLIRWLDLFPEQIIQVHPGLRIAQLYQFALGWDVAAMAASIDHTITLVQADLAADWARRQLRLAVLDGLKGYLSYWLGNAAGAMTPLQRCLDYLTDSAAYSFTVSNATNLLALAYANQGERTASLDLVQKAHDEAMSHKRPAMILYLLTRTNLHLYAGELAEAAAAAERALALADSPDWSGMGVVQVWRGWAHYHLGTVRYEQNDLELAAQHWRQVEAMRYQVNPGTFHDSLTGLALIAQAKAETVHALAYAQAGREFALELHNPPLLMLSEALEVRLALRGSHQAEVLRRARLLTTTTNIGNAFWLALPHLTVLRGLLAEGKPASLAAALQLASTVLGQAEGAHNTRLVIHAAALRGLVWRALRRTPEALADLDRALTLAEPGGIVRTFLDLGAPLTKLLQLSERQRGRSPYVRHLLAAFAGEPALARRDALTAQTIQLYDITPLTRRELELLALIGQRFTNDEMAERLVISPNTVKKHVGSIYSKLGVKNRRQAIAKAVEVGLLPPP